MYLDENAKKMVLNLSKVVADQQSKIEELTSSKDTYQRWYKDLEEENSKLKKRLNELDPPTPINLDVIDSSGTKNFEI